MTFENPFVFALLLLLPLMIALFIWRSRVRAVAITHIGESDALKTLMIGINDQRRRWKSGLWLATVFALVIALARPVFGVDADVVEARGVAVIVALDVSTSMDAQDVKPSRIERAKLAIRDLLQGAEGNLFGLVLFAGDAFVQFPLTTDIDSALTFVNAASSKSITRQGTAIEDALWLSLGTFDERITSRSIILLMTDGENQQGDPLAAAKSAAERGITIHVIGYGTPEGDVIPVYDSNGKVIAYKTDRGNNLVITKLDEPILQQIAETTGGLYQRASDSGIEIVNIQNRIAEVEGELLATRFQTRPVERFGIFVALALIALTAEMVISEKRAEGKRSDE